MTDRIPVVKDQPALRSLLSVMSDGVLATDTQGTRIYSNPALDDFVGGDACVPRHSTAPPAFLPPESRERYLYYVELMIRGTLAPDTITLDFQVTDADGSTHEIPIRLIPVISQRGRATGMLWVFYLNSGPATTHARDLERALSHIAEELRSVGFAPETRPQVLGLAELSPREHEVFELLLVGHRVSTMADQLCLSKHTVRNHLKSIFKKTGVHSQAELIQLVRGPNHDDETNGRNGNGSSGSSSNGHRT